MLEEGSEGALTDAFAAIHADCCAAMHYCLEIHKHFYPARYCLGRLLVAAGDVIGAQQVLSFCFKGRGGFGLNLWEEEAFRLPKSFRGVSDKVSEGDWKPGRPCRSVQSIGRDESSRKFVAKLRKIAVLYLLCCAQLALLRHAENLDGSEYVAYIEALSRFLRTNDYWQKCMADVAHFSVALLVNTLLCVMKIPRLSGTGWGTLRGALPRRHPEGSGSEPISSQFLSQTVLRDFRRAGRRFKGGLGSQDAQRFADAPGDIKDVLGGVRSSLR